MANLRPVGGYRKPERKLTMDDITKREQNTTPVETMDDTR